jgi:hypothetical protein
VKRAYGQYCEPQKVGYTSARSLDYLPKVEGTGFVHEASSASATVAQGHEEAILGAARETAALSVKVMEQRMDIASSINGVPIRLSYERWYHIVENHDEMASYFHEVLEAVEGPNFVVRGNGGALKAVRSLGKRKWLAVVYREVSRTDGFVITAYLLDSRPKGKIVWRRQ